MDALAIAQAAFDAFKLHHAIGEGEEGVVFSLANIHTGKNGRAALTDQDGTGGDRFAAIGLDAQALGVGIAAIAR